MSRQRRFWTPRRTPPHGELETFWAFWMSLTPAERMRRCFAMLRNLKDPDAVHDAKLFPKP